MGNGGDILERVGNLTPIERAVIDKANRVQAMVKEGQLTSLESSHQLWAIRDVLTAVDPGSKVIERLHQLEKDVLRAR